MEQAAISIKINFNQIIKDKIGRLFSKDNRGFSKIECIRWKTFR